jgi:hypothetical protein
MTGDAILWHRMQFAFTVTYHYLFPQLTMGLEKPPGGLEPSTYALRMRRSTN